MSDLALAIKARLQTKFPKSSIGFAGEPISTRSTLRGVIITKLDVLNNYIFADIGGIPLGRMGEIFAEEGRGKSSLGMEIIASAQRQGGVGILIETEATFERNRAEALGVDCDSLILCEPSSVEEVLDQLDTLLADVVSTQDHPVVVVWDSLAATPTVKELEDGMMEKKAAMAERGRVLARSMRVMSMRAAETGVAVVIINQAREKIGVTFGDPTTTPSSGVLKFHVAWRLHIQGGATAKKGDETVGLDVSIYSRKNKVSPDKRKFRARILYESGWDANWMIVNFAKDVGVLSDDTKVSAKAAQVARTELHWPGGDNESIIPTFDGVTAPKKAAVYKKAAPAKKGAK